VSASFLLDESAPTSVLKVLKKRGFEAARLIDIGLIGFKNSEVAELSIREKSGQNTTKASGCFLS